MANTKQRNVKKYRNTHTSYSIDGAAIAKDTLELYAIFDDGVAQWLTQCKENIRKYQNTRIFNYIDGTTIAKDIFKLNAMFDDGVSQWLTQRREI